MKVYLVGASGKLGQCMVQQALDRGYEWLASAGRVMDLDGQVEASERVFASNTRWAMVRERPRGGERQGLSVSRSSSRRTHRTLQRLGLRRSVYGPSAGSFRSRRATHTGWPHRRA
jgi:hypothetical protein